MPRIPNLGLVNSLFYIFFPRVLLTSLPYHCSPSTSKRTLVIPSLPPGVSGWDILFSSILRICTRISDLQFSQVIFNYSEFHSLAIWRLSALLFIYSFFYLLIQFSMSRSVTLQKPIQFRYKNLNWICILKKNKRMEYFIYSAQKF